MSDVVRIPDWTDDAACTEIGVEPFFPEYGVGSGDAKRICAGCPVRTECLKYALTYESGAMGIDLGRGPEGIYGGLTPAERRAILRDRRTAQEEDAA